MACNKIDPIYTSMNSEKILTLVLKIAFAAVLIVLGSKIGSCSGKEAAEKRLRIENE